MNVNTGRDLIKTRVGRFSAATTLDAQVVDEMVAAQQRLEQGPTLPWFAVTQASKVTSVADQTPYALESDFLDIVDHELAPFTLEDTGNSNAMSRLKFRDLVTLEGDYPPETADSGEPLFFTVVGTNFRVYPAPEDTDYRFRYWYYQQDTVPVAGGNENNWLKYYPDLLLNEAAIYVAESLGNDKAISFFQKKRDEARGLYVADVIARMNRMYPQTPED